MSRNIYARVNIRSNAVGGIGVRRSGAITNVVLAADSIIDNFGAATSGF